MNYHKLLFIKTAFLVGTLALSGCSSAELAKVKEFSRLAQVAKERSDLVGKDFYPSCLRAAQLVPVNPIPITSTEQNIPTEDSSLGSISEEAKKTLEELERARQELELALENTALSNDEDPSELQSSLDNFQDSVFQNSSDPLVLRNDLRTVCDQHLQGIGYHFTSVNGAVILYVTKLGLIADNNLTNLSPEFNAIQTSANNLAGSARTLFSIGQPVGTPVISQQQLGGKVNAVLGIFQFITEAILKVKRQEVLQSVILDKNDDFQEVLEALKTVVNDYYIAIELQNEEGFIDIFYTTYIDSLEQSQTFQSGTSVIPVTRFLLELDASWIKEKELIQARRELAQAYIGILNALSVGHNQLYKIFLDGDQPSQEQLNSILNENTTALKTFIEKSKLLNIKETK